jgi:hypothetical protein
MGEGMGLGLVSICTKWLSVRGECKLIKVIKEENTLIRGGV